MISDEQSPALEAQQPSPEAPENLAAVSEIAVRIKKLRENAPEIRVERVWAQIKKGLQPRS